MDTFVISAVNTKNVYRGEWNSDFLKGCALACVTDLRDDIEPFTDNPIVSKVLPVLGAQIEHLNMNCEAVAVSWDNKCWLPVGSPEQAYGFSNTTGSYPHVMFMVKED